MATGKATRLRRRAAALCVLAFASACGLPARAQPDISDSFPHALVFASSDIRAREMFGHTGFKVTPFQPVTETGFVAQSMMTSGRKTYSARGGGSIEKTLMSASLLGGYQIARDDYFLTLMAGLEWAQRRTSPADADDGHLGSGLGLRVQADLWLRPTPETLLVVTALVGTASNAFWVRVAPGYRVMDDIYVGPETAVSSEFGEASARAGLHVTGFQWRGIWLTASGGIAFTEDGKSGPYGSLIMVKKF